jgi:hypothetical protein
MTYNRMEAKPIAASIGGFVVMPPRWSNAVLSAVDMLRYGLFVVSRRRAMSSRA